MNEPATDQNEKQAVYHVAWIVRPTPDHQRYWYAVAGFLYIALPDKCPEGAVNRSSAILSHLPFEKVSNTPEWAVGPKWPNSPDLRAEAEVVDKMARQNGVYVYGILLRVGESEELVKKADPWLIKT